MKSKLIEEVCIIRLLLIVLLVLYHSFAPWCGAWRPIVGMAVAEDAYWWIGKASYSSMLECFTFVSGWVFGFQVMKKGSMMLEGKRLISSKLRRLIIPSFVFSIAYLLLLTPSMFKQPLSALMSIVEGVGHMWYLPMLFWCFIGIWLIEKRQITNITAIACLFALASLSFIPLPLRLGSAMYYMVFFYGGYLVGRKVINLDRHLDKWKILGWGTAFTVAFIIGTDILTPLFEVKKQTAVFANGGGKALYISAITLLRIVYSSLGVIFIVLSASYLIKKEYIKLNDFWIQVSTYTFGIYLFQQFILQWLFYHTDISYYIDIDAIPWMGAVIALLLSYVLTALTRKTRLGRQLI